MPFFIGTAGWTIPKQHLPLFPTSPDALKPSHLALYATQFRCVEINSSFHRPHRRSTWESWAATTPGGFRFAVKAPKTITHIAKLVNTGPALLDFFNAANAPRRQTRPGPRPTPAKARLRRRPRPRFFTTLRELHTGPVVLEPRHATWFTSPVDRLLRSFEVARVAADPPKAADLAAQPGGWPGLALLPPPRLPAHVLLGLRRFLAGQLRQPTPQRPIQSR